VFVARPFGNKLFNKQTRHSALHDSSTSHELRLLRLLVVLVLVLVCLVSGVWCFLFLFAV
jgi:hypothetical protein